MAHRIDTPWKVHEYVLGIERMLKMLPTAKSERMKCILLELETSIYHDKSSVWF